MSIYDDFKERAGHPTPEQLEETLSPVTVRLPASSIKKVAYLANKLGCTRQSILRDILTDGLDEAFHGFTTGSGMTPEEYESLISKFNGYNVTNDDVDFINNEDQQEFDV